MDKARIGHAATRGWKPVLGLLSLLAGSRSSVKAGFPHLYTAISSCARSVFQSTPQKPERTAQSLKKVTRTENMIKVRKAVMSLTGKYIF
uniref:hypothetical protein n=1 Tax=Pararhizobium sp. IMCC3301 TaxID=3067904 RepID=UPI00274179A2|nr:hypothetical protein [Pararhizobium sp. IMCC3301]